MARVYDVVCLKCGAVWEWCKYDRPDDKCPECKAKTTSKCEPYNGFDGFPVDRDWDESRVKVFGVWSTGAEVKKLSEEIRRENGSPQEVRPKARRLR